MNLAKRNKILIICLSAILAVGLIVGGYFLFRPAKKTTQEWLDNFSSSISSFSSLNNQGDGNINFERKIEIHENGILVASYFQGVQIRNQEEGIVAKLIVEEKYPTSESNEFDIYDEYWLVGNKMYTLRCVSGENLKGSFPSNIDIFIQLANEHIGGAKYNLVEDNFETFSIVEEKGLHKLSTIIKKDKVNSFIEMANSPKIFEVKLDVSINEKFELDSFCLAYNDEDSRTNKISLNVFESQQIIFSDWIKELLL